MMPTTDATLLQEPFCSWNKCMSVEKQGSVRIWNHWQLMILRSKPWPNRFFLCLHISLVSLLTHKLRHFIADHVAHSMNIHLHLHSSPLIRAFTCLPLCPSSWSETESRSPKPKQVEEEKRKVGNLMTWCLLCGPERCLIKICQRWNWTDGNTRNRTWPTTAERDQSLN